MPLHPSYKNSQDKQIDLQVFVYTRPNLRADDMFVYIGTNIIQNIFEDLKVDENTKFIKLFYPERWTNLLEQRALLSRIPLLYPNIEKVEITTHSVYIIQCTQACQIGICDKSSDYPETGNSYTNLKHRFCPPLSESKELTILGG